MARPESYMAAETITLSLNAQTLWYLERLMDTGLYGNGHAEAAKIVIGDHCKLLIGQGKLAEAPPVPGSSARAINAPPSTTKTRRTP